MAWILLFLIAIQSFSIPVSLKQLARFNIGEQKSYDIPCLRSYAIPFGTSWKIQVHCVVVIPDISPDKTHRFKKFLLGDILDTTVEEQNRFALNSRYWDAQYVENVQLMITAFNRTHRIGQTESDGHIEVAINVGSVNVEPNHVNFFEIKLPLEDTRNITGDILFPSSDGYAIFSDVDVHSPSYLAYFK